MVASRTNRKDTVPPQKSQTRGSSRPASKPELGKLPNAKVVDQPKVVKKQPVVKSVQFNPASHKKVVLKSKAKAASGLRRNSSQGLPRGTVNRGLKMPKGGQSSDAIQRRLKNKSPWFQSILDPLHGADCKIPDETGIETGTLQLVEKHAVTTNSSGVTGFRVSTPYINNVPQTWVKPANPDILTYGANWQFHNPTASAIEESKWGYLGPYGELADFNGKYAAFEGVEDFRSMIDSHRIVSAGLYIQPEPSLADNKGEYTMWIAPMSKANDSSETETYSDLANLYKSVSIPLNSNSPGCIRWVPIDKQDESFKAFFTTNAEVIGLQVGSESPTCPFWEMGFACDGCAEDVVFRVTVVINYEFVPKYNSLNIIDAAPSPSDATETDLVENWVQELDVGTTIPIKKISSSPSTVAPEHGENDEGTGFGMFFNVIKELAPLALALL